MNTNHETSLRDRAIAIRQRWISHELTRIPRFRSNELADVFEQRAIARELIAKWRRSIKVLEAMPVDVTDDEVRRAMGVG